MAVKKKVARKSKQLKPKPPAHRPCSQQPCKRIAAYCRWEGEDEDRQMVSYCAKHWKSVVESKKEWARNMTRHMKAEEQRRLAAQSKNKKRVVKRVKK